VATQYEFAINNKKKYLEPLGYGSTLYVLTVCRTEVYYTSLVMWPVFNKMCCCILRGPGGERIMDTR